MKDPDFLGVGWKFPPTMRNNALLLSEGEDVIRESILLILRTTRGERIMRPDFGCGINDMVFAENNATTHTLLAEVVNDALLEFEPRVNVNDVRVTADPDEDNRVNIEIEYTIKSSNAKENIVYPFFLENG